MRFETGPSAQDGPDIVAADARGPALIVCEHASNRIPGRYDGLGLTPAARESHAAWDPGARELARHLADALGSPMVAARVSRLVYDCNRPPESEGAMPALVERIEIPANRALDDTARKERVASVYKPFRAAVESVLDARRAAGLPSALVTVHSFTPSWFDRPRKTEIGLLHDADTRLADAMLARAGDALPHRIVARNDPYGPEDGVTHSLRIYGVTRGIPNVMIEARNDLLATSAACTRIAEELLSLLKPALSELPDSTTADDHSGDRLHA